MPSFGMIGAIGGVGQGLVNEGAEIAKDEARVKDVAAKKDYEGWLLSQQDQYKVADDKRAWANEQARAPVKRDMKVADETASAQGKIDVNTRNRDTLAANTQAETNAKKTPEERQEISQRGDYYASGAELNRGAKADSLAARNAAKMDPADEKEVADIHKLLEKKQELIDEVRSGKAGVPWDPEKNPGQKAMMTEVSALQMRARTIYDRNRRSGGGQGGGTPDPLNLRKNGTGAPPPAARGGLQATSDGTELPAQPGMVGAFTGKPDDAMMAVADIKDPQDRANAKAALLSQINANNGSLPGAVSPGALRQPAAPAARPAAPAVATQPPQPYAPSPDGSSPEMDAQLNAQGQEINKGTRTAYTPEVDAYRKVVGTLRRQIQAQRQNERNQAIDRNRRAGMSTSNGLL